VWAVRKFQHYLLGAPFTLETDHKPLECLESAKVSHAHSQRLERWSLELRAYDFKVICHPGTDNTHVDSLFRLSLSLVALEAPLTITEIYNAQRSDPTLSLVMKMVMLPPQLIGKDFFYVATSRYGHSSCYMKPSFAAK